MSKISEKLNIINNAKNDIKTAIEEKGINVGDAGIQEYANKISEIEIPDMNDYYNKAEIDEWISEIESLLSEV
jgi:hypothetical protein